MNPAERERVLASLDETREEYRRIAQGLSHSQLHYKPAADRWSVAEALEHIIVVETRVLAALDKALRQPPRASKSAIEDDHLVRMAAQRTAKLKSPDPVIPNGRWPDDRLLEEFEAIRKRSTEFARSANAELRHHSFPHPFFGELDCYQWLLLIPAHCQRHLAQAKEVMAEPNFPRAASAS